MDPPSCMKALLLAATEYRAAKTPHNAALLQRSMEVGAAPEPEARRERGVGGAVVIMFYGVFTERDVLRVYTHSGQADSVGYGGLKFFIYPLNSGPRESFHSLKNSV